MWEIGAWYRLDQSVSLFFSFLFSYIQTLYNVGWDFLKEVFIL